MKVFADLHIHSHYSRATSDKMNINELEKFAKIKGLNLLGTGDFTHPIYFKELKSKLSEDGSGIVKTKSGFSYVLQTEVANFFFKNNISKKVHNIIITPSFAIAEQINEYLSKFGSLSSDGRPMLKLSCSEMTEGLMQISKEIIVIPAHCLLPGTIVHCNPDDKRIEDIKIGDKVLTHNRRFETVSHLFERNYSGKVYRIIPWYFREGIATTPEHPLLSIKSFKNCSWIKGICKPLCSQRMFCKKKIYQNYESEWIQAKDIEVGDFLLYPRPTEVRDIKIICIDKITNRKKIENGMVISQTWKGNRIKNIIFVDKIFCRLAGYYIAEGYIIGNEAIGFSFNKKEKKYADEIINFMKTIFGISKFKVDSRKKSQMDIIFYSRILNEFFKKLFYDDGFRAWNKCLPDWMVFLPKEKLAEVLRGWWRGDLGYTVSRKLANQMKMICLKLGIIPSISIDTAEKFNTRGKHVIDGRKIIASRDTFIFSNLSFFENDYKMLKEKCFRKFLNKRMMKHGWMDDKYAYLPVRKIETNVYNGKVYNLEVDKDNSYLTEYAAVHNCWTPWFSLFGSKSGFDNIKDCFHDQTKNIFALETGLSSDPKMNWRLSQLDKFSLISNSDCHSPYPWRLGREANVFELGELSYRNLFNAIKNKNPKEFLFTIEVNPNYGKYHFDGHRNCRVFLSPAESKKYKDTCPVCKRQLTIGVLHRVEELADREEGFVPKNSIPFKSLLPLYEIISYVTGTNQLYSKKVIEIQDKLIERFGTELAVLLEAPEEEIKKIIDERIAQAIIKNRFGRIKIQPGYDGVYGTPIFDNSAQRNGSPQKRLDKFFNM